MMSETDTSRVKICLHVCNIGCNIFRIVRKSYNDEKKQQRMQKNHYLVPHCNIMV
jgi:hypothetical protein